MAGDDALRYAQIASLAAFTVAGLALISWLLRLSVLVKLISDSILVGFKTGAGLTIAMTQLPSLFGVAGGGHNFFERLVLLLGQLGETNPIVLAVGLLAIGNRRGRSTVSRARSRLSSSALAIIAATLLGLPAMGVPITGAIPSGLPSLHGPALRLRDVEGIVPLAGGVLLLAYIEGVSAARSFAAKHGYALDPRQEFLGIGAANLFAALGQGYPVAGGLSQSAVNDKAGARTPLALVFTSITLAICLLFLTGLLENLPKAVLAAVVLTAVAGLVNFPELRRMSRVSRVDFYAATIALIAVLLLGILQGILLAALASIIMLLIRASRPHVAFLGRIPGTYNYSDIDRHPENEPLGMPSCSARKQPDLCECRHRSGGGLDAFVKLTRRHPAGRLRSFRRALYGPCRFAHAARAPGRTCQPWHRSASSVLVERCAICCEPMVSRTRLADLIEPRRLRRCSVLIPSGLEGFRLIGTFAHCGLQKTSSGRCLPDHLCNTGGTLATLDFDGDLVGDAQCIRRHVLRGYHLEAAT